MGTLHFRKKSRLKRKARIRKKIFGTPQRPRLTVFRSTKHVYAQIIDDTCGKTLVTATTLEKEVREHPKFENKVAQSEFIGKLVAERAIDKGIKTVIFDRNGFLYHGRVKAVSDGARNVGLDF